MTNSDKLLLPSSSEDDESDYSLSEEEIYKSSEDQFSESDEDEGPESLSFSKARKNDWEQRQETSKVIQTHLDERKKKRKEIREQYQKLKEQKVQNIEQNKLPDEILQTLDDNESHEAADCISETISDVSKLHKKKRTCEIEKEYGSVKFKCKVLSEEAKKPKYVSETVSNFKNALLYGGRIRREKSSRDAALKKRKQVVS